MDDSVSDPSCAIFKCQAWTENSCNVLELILKFLLLLLTFLAENKHLRSTDLVCARPTKSADRALLVTSGCNLGQRGGGQVTLVWKRGDRRG